MPCKPRNPKVVVEEMIADHDRVERRQRDGSD